METTKKDTYDSSINFKDLIFAVLYRWRTVLFVATSMGLLLGGFRLIQRLSNMYDSTIQVEAQESYESDLLLYESNKSAYEREIDDTSSKIESLNEYIQNSILMQVNPYDKPIAYVDLYIKTDYEIMPSMTFQNADYTASILKSYTAALKHGELFDDLDHTKMNLGVEQLSELVTTEVDFTNHMLHIESTSLNVENANVILEQILANINLMKDAVSEKIGVHEITVMNQGSANIIDSNLAKTQNDTNNTLMTLQDTLTAKRAALAALKEPKNITFSKKSALKSGIKYGILGGMMGAFASMFLICIVFLLKDELTSAQELRNRYGLKILGVFSRTHNHKLFSKIDCLIDKLAGSELISAETTDKIICVNIKNLSTKTGKLILIGSIEKAELELITQRLITLIPDKEIICGGNLNIDAQALQQLSANDSAIIVEKCGISKYEKIQIELQTLEDNSTDVLGCIVI